MGWWDASTFLTASYMQDEVLSMFMISRALMQTAEMLHLPL